MNNFTLRFGKHKGEQFFSTPLSYQQWLLEQKFIVSKDIIDCFEKGDKVTINYRHYVSKIVGRSGVNNSNVHFKNMPKYTSYEGVFISNRKNSIIVELQDNGTTFKSDFNKNCIASIDKIN